MSKALTLGTKPIGSLLFHYSLPAIVAMTATSLYNIMDSVFIGHGIGALALAGLSATFPFMNLSAALGMLVGVGASTLVSVKLGQQDYESASQCLGNVVILNIIIGTVFMVLSLLFLDPILYFFGASPATLAYARDYMEVILLGNVITHLYMGLNNVLRASGHPREAMIVTLISVVLNVVFDYSFVFIIDWGIRGVAIGTILAQTIALVIVCAYFFRPSSVLRFEKKIFHLSKKITQQVLSIGFAPFCMNALACLIVTLINTGLYKYGGDMHVGAYGVANRVVFFFVMIILGFNQGMQPIAGFNYGAQQYKRVLEVYHDTVYWVVGFTALGWVLCVFFPELLVGMFTTDPELSALSTHSIRLMTLFLPLIGYQMVSINLFQSIGKAKIAVFLSTTRQLLFLIPFLIVLPLFWGTEGIWWSMPLSDVISAIVVTVMVIRLLKQLKQLAV